jgi:hypothetical protein
LISWICLLNEALNHTVLVLNHFSADVKLHAVVWVNVERFPRTLLLLAVKVAVYLRLADWRNILVSFASCELLDD